MFKIFINFIDPTFLIHSDNYTLNLHNSFEPITHHQTSTRSNPAPRRIPNRYLHTPIYPLPIYSRPKVPLSVQLQSFPKTKANPSTSSDTRAKMPGHTHASLQEIIPQSESNYWGLA